MDDELIFPAVLPPLDENSDEFQVCRKYLNYYSCADVHINTLQNITMLIANHNIFFNLKSSCTLTYFILTRHIT